MKKYIKILGFCLVLGSALITTGCSKDDDDSSSSKPGFNSNKRPGTYNGFVLCPKCNEEITLTCRISDDNYDWTITDSKNNPCKIDCSGYVVDFLCTCGQKLNYNSSNLH